MHFLIFAKKNLNMGQRLYPIGQQDFPSIRNEGKVYVDKTMYALDVIQSSKSNFLSKPRRFGKSLFISTLESIFLGRKELFEGLYIYDKWQFEEYPMIRISFSNIGYRTMGLLNAIANELQSIAEKNELLLKSDRLDIANVHKELIEKLYLKYKKGVVILIDEYDKPIIDYLDKDKIELAKTNRDVLKTFYSILKDAEPYLKFLFIIGVSKFSKVSIFSDLNNLTDLSINLAYNEICGISQKELEENFKEELKLYDKEKIKQWYNGYKFHPNGKSVYNPFSILNFFRAGDYNNYWYSTGTPTFLMKMCREQHLYEFDVISINQSDLGNFDIENLKIEPILFQTGYLTIVGENPLFRSYKLGFPNMEVRESYLRNLLEAYIDTDRLKSSIIFENLSKAFETKDKELFKDTINSAFAHIPYSLWQKENEQYYHALVHLIFSLMGVYIFSEVQTQKGRTDAVVMYLNEVYILEFKLNKTAEEAYFQIEKKGYADRFKGMPVHKIGINFSSEKKAIEDVYWVM
jgi:Predicted AAA-ATPase/PD-(D/E)XK nuclease superfamily